jgi:hypothetical protein
MMTSKQFVCYFVGACLLLLVTIAAFNRVVDPFWYYRDIEIEGFNAIKTKFRRYERDVKPALLVREQPEAIILGSSYSEIGFNPTNPYFTRHGQLTSMNFGFAGAIWQMVQCEFEYAITHAPIKRAVVGMYLGTAMPNVDCSKEYASIGKISVSELLFSNRTLIASVQTLTGQKKEQPSHTREGMYFYTRNIAGVDQRFKEEFVPRVNEKPQCSQAANSDYEPPLPLTEANFDLSGLQHVINLAHQHHIELVLFAYPHHAYSLELDRQCGTQLARWQAMKQIARLNEQQTEKAVAIWQFDAYNAITAEPIGTMATYWQDAAHFNFEMGDLMLADMFNETNDKPTLGRLIYFNTLDADYQHFLQQRSAYLQAHPEFQANLQKLTH